jgi:hypothetical protein
MTTPGSVRTKLWRSGNKKRYSDYQREYMKKYREKQKMSPLVEEGIAQQSASNPTGSIPVPDPFEGMTEHFDDSWLKPE